MSATRRQAPRQRRTASRSKLLAALHTLLGSGASLTELSVEHIIEEAGVTRPTFYAHFADKGELLCAALDEITESLEATPQPWFALGWDATRVDLTRALLDVLQAYGKLAPVAAAATEAAAYDARVAECSAAVMETQIAGLEAHIRRGRRDGRLSKDVLPRETAVWLIWMLDRVVHRDLRKLSSTELKPHAETFTDIVWQTLYAVPNGGE